MKAKHFIPRFIFLLIFDLTLSLLCFSEDDALPFKKLSTTNDGVHIQKVFDNILKTGTQNGFHPQKIFSSDDYKKGQYSRAWNQATQYYPNRYMYIPNNTYLMMHGLYNGRVCIEVFRTEILNTIIQNQKIFNYNTIVQEYNKIKNNEAKKKEFDEKLGKLAGYFNNQASHQQLIKYLGKDLYNELMEALREENQHMITAALIHEGMHALLSNKETYDIQQDFQNGRLSMELNELRAYMAEILYHCQYSLWAKKDILNHWDEIDNLISQLEQMRRQKPPEITPEEKKKIEEIKAKIKAQIALIRVRLRELKNSAKRMEDLMIFYKNNYIKNVAADKDKIDPGLNLKNQFNALEVAISAYRLAIDNYANDVEKALKNLENILDLWNTWADCKILTPPPADSTKRLIDSTRTKPFPDPPVKPSEELKKNAEDEIGRNYSVIDDKAGTDLTSKFTRFTFSGGLGYSGTSMNDLNNYYDYLNKTWNGNIHSINGGLSINIGFICHFSKNIGAGLSFENIASSSDGKLSAYNTSYTSKNNVNAILVSLDARTNQFFGNLSFIGSLEAGPYFSHYTEEESDFITEGEDQTIGFKLSGGMEYMIAPAFGMQIVTGYRSAKLNDHDASFFLPGNPPVSLDYSGFFGEFKVIVKLK